MARLIDADELLKEKFTMGFGRIPVVFVNSIENAPTITAPNEWVSAKERLPKPFECVIVCYANRSVHLAWVYTNGKWLFEERYGSVTHWMPLPAPPDLCPPDGEEGA